MDANTVFPPSGIKITLNLILPSKKLSNVLILFGIFLITSHFKAHNFALIYYWGTCSVLKALVVSILKCFTWCISTGD